MFETRKHLKRTVIVENAKHIMQSYRAYILGCKRKFGTARGLIHYRDYLQAYLEAKREVLKNISRCFGTGGEAVTGCCCKSVYKQYVETPIDTEGTMI